MRTRFVTSGTDLNSFPKAVLPEIAFLGRSNVGKSSLLNALAGAKIARTSKTPGRTQMINFFEVAGHGYSYVLADLPGYGFAEAPKENRKQWLRLIETYVGKREGLLAILMLIDMRRGIQEEDLEIYRSLVDQGRKVLIVATKCDKLGKAHQKPTLKKIAESIALDLAAVHPTSASTGAGIEALRDTLKNLVTAVGQTSVDSSERG